MTEAEALTKYDEYLKKQARAFHRRARYQRVPLDDFIQEARMAFLRHIRTHDERQWADCFLTIRSAMYDYARICYPLTISRYGFSRRCTEGTTFVSDECLDAITTMIHEDDHSGIDLREAITHLSQMEREIVLMRLEGMTLDEIGSKLGISHQGISYHLKLIRRKMVS